MADKLIYSWNRIPTAQAKAEYRGNGPLLIQAPVYEGQRDLAEVSIVQMEGKDWIDLDSGYDNHPPIPVDDLVWLLREAGKL
jgi:hypothetical protein